MGFYHIDIMKDPTQLAREILDDRKKEKKKK